MLVSLFTMVALGFGSLFSGAVFVGVGVVIGHAITLQAIAHEQDLSNR